VDVFGTQRITSSSSSLVGRVKPHTKLINVLRVKLRTWSTNRNKKKTQRITKMWAYLANPSIAWDACFWQRPLPPGFKLCLRRPYKRLQSDGCNVRTCPQSMDRRCVISVNVNETTTDKAAASDIEPAYDQRPHRSLWRQSTWQLTTTAYYFTVAPPVLSG